MSSAVVCEKAWLLRVRVLVCVADWGRDRGTLLLVSFGPLCWPFMFCAAIHWGLLQVQEEVAELGPHDLT